ncbi:hypothetical protein ACOMHN_001018 [Nucella lapillus]
MEGQAGGQRSSSDLHIHNPSHRQSLPGPSRNTKSPILSLAERIMIAKLDPENFSMETTSCKEVQQAVAMTPRPSLSDLIHMYRRMETEELELEHSMLERVKDAHDCLRSVASSVHSPEMTERQHRVLGLYQELKHINVHSTRPSALRLNVTKRHTSELDVRIEWGRQLPEGDNTLRVKYRTKPRKTSSEPRSLHFKQKYFRRNYSENFIFLDDDVFPQVELRHSGGEGFCPDVKWFLRPGVASEQCDVGFTDGKFRDRKGRAWMSLRNKCMSRVHIMKSLEVKSFANLPKLKLN